MVSYTEQAYDASTNEINEFYIVNSYDEDDFVIITSEDGWFQ